MSTIRLVVLVTQIVSHARFMGKHLKRFTSLSPRPFISGISTNLNIFRLLLLLPRTRKTGWVPGRPAPRYCYFRLREPNKLRCFESWVCIMRTGNVGDIQIYGKHQCILFVVVPVKWRKLRCLVGDGRLPYLSLMLSHHKAMAVYKWGHNKHSYLHGCFEPQQNGLPTK